MDYENGLFSTKKKASRASQSKLRSVSLDDRLSLLQNYSSFPPHNSQQPFDYINNCEPIKMANYGPKPGTCKATDRVGYMWRNRSHGVRLRASVGSLTEAQEAWLEQQGLTIKVMQRNQEPLFRAVAEELFMTQANAEKVKQMVVKYLSDQFGTMEQRIRLAYGKEMAMKPCAQLERDVYELGNAFGKEPVTPWHAYIYRLANGTNVAGTIEIGAMSALFKVNILVYRAIPSTPLTFGKFVGDGNNKMKKNTIKLLNFYGSNHYDLLVPTETVKAAAMCQSIVYEVLYEKVFGLENTLAASSAALGTVGQEIKGEDPAAEEDQKLLSSSSSSSSTSASSRRFNRKDPDALNNIKQSWLPFPLKVAKSLDPSTYRDNDLDGK